MREDFLHYIWNYQKFNTEQLRTVDGQSLTILNVGTSNSNAGPDFLMAEIALDGKRWVGHVEIHIRASDWLQHRHDTDPNYNPVILHVVWKHDVAISLPNGGTLPVLELASRVSEALCSEYDQWMNTLPAFIPCEKQFGQVPDIYFEKWMERLFIERLESKCAQLQAWLQESKYHWEAVCFYALARAFGMKVNAEAFLSMARSVDFRVIQKCRTHPIVLEALFLGQLGILDELPGQEAFGQSLQATYLYLKRKFGVENKTVVRPKFFRLRPANFTTLRCSQLAQLWSTHSSLTAKIMSIQNLEEAISIFEVQASSYWDTHYQIGKTTTSKPKKVSRRFIHLLILNVVLPIQMIHGKMYGQLQWEVLEQLAQELPMEDNKLIRKYQGLRRMHAHAWNGQALLHLHDTYCKAKRCSHCTIGTYLMEHTQLG